jgi:hypothetical protein
MGRDMREALLLRRPQYRGPYDISHDGQRFPRAGASSPARFGADNVARGARYYKKVADISWNLCAEAGGRSTTLAGGMNGVTAYGLMGDVSKILAMQVT